jgi:hypothetical protein
MIRSCSAALLFTAELKDMGRYNSAWNRRNWVQVANDMLQNDELRKIWAQGKPEPNLEPKKKKGYQA